MNIKLSALTAAILAGISGTAMAQTPPTATVITGPDGFTQIYANGPNPTNSTHLSAPERSAFALMEGLMQITEAKIYADGNCNPATFDVETYADGVVRPNLTNNPPADIATEIANTNHNVIIVTGAGGSQAPQFTLGASLEAAWQNRGQQVNVGLKAGNNFLGATQLINQTGQFTYNNFNNMMVNTNTAISLMTKGVQDNYQSSVIKDFFLGSPDSTNPEHWNVYDWGIQSLSKLGYPVNKYWQSSKVHRDNGSNGHTMWVKDRLVGSTVCRITLDTYGFNNSGQFWQGNDAIGAGTLTIKQEAPSVTPVPGWDVAF